MGDTAREKQKYSGSGTANLTLHKNFLYPLLWYY